MLTATLIEVLLNLKRKDVDKTLNNEIRWEKPTPLRGNRANLIDFPVNALPPILREMTYAIVIPLRNMASIKIKSSL